MFICCVVFLLVRVMLDGYIFVVVRGVCIVGCWCWGCGGVVGLYFVVGNGGVGSVDLDVVFWYFCGCIWC